jgi:threonine efflux protein
LEHVHIAFILGAALVASASPGPATLAIANASVDAGRRFGLAVASGVTTGSVLWSITAAAGVGAIIGHHASAMAGLRAIGAAYLLYLAYKSAKSALNPSRGGGESKAVPSIGACYAQGLAVHLTNPKAILFFVSLFAIGIPSDAQFSTVWPIVVALALQSMFVFHAYALIFASPWIVTRYSRLRRWFDAAFALAFGVAAVRTLGSAVV